MLHCLLRGDKLFIISKQSSTYLSCLICKTSVVKEMDLSSGKETETPVTIMNVFKEFNDCISPKYKIMKFKSKVCIQAFHLVIVSCSGLKGGKCVETLSSGGGYSEMQVIVLESKVKDGFVQQRDEYAGIRLSLHLSGCHIEVFSLHVSSFTLADLPSECVLGAWIVTVSYTGVNML